MKRTLLIYGLFLGILVFILKITEYWFWVKLNAFDIYALLIAIVFLGTGLWLGWRLQNKKAKPVSLFSANEKNIKKLNISKREQEVLVLLGKGLSNQEIADQLYVSQSTIKTHTSRLFEKLDVKNRTQAILKAKELDILNE